MSQKLSPFIESKFGWEYGESGWNSGMDENLTKFSFLFDRNIDAIVSTLPSTPVNGQAFFLTTDNRMYFRVESTWYSTPTPKWFEFQIRSTGVVYRFDGTSISVVESPSSFDSRIDALDVIVSGLGTAAFEDSGFFATQAELDVVEASLSSDIETVSEGIIATEERFEQELFAAGYEFLGNYTADLNIATRKQYFRRGDRFYAANEGTALPYTTTGTWATDKTSLVLLGDDVLRQELGSPNGASMIGRGVMAVDSVADLLALPAGQRKEGLRYLVKGYYAGSDLGGGIFCYVASQASVNDGGYNLDGFVRVRSNNTVSVSEFGARGDGTTDDCSSILLAVNYLNAIGGGRLLFKKTSAFYAIHVSNFSGAWSTLFPLGSDIEVVFEEGAKLRMIGATSVASSCSIFGVNKSMLPVKNLVFRNLDIAGISLASINNNPLGIGLYVEDGDPVNSIENVLVEGCTFRNLEGSVYAVHRSFTNKGLGGRTDRQVKNLRVTKCNAYGSVGSFVTADVNGGVIDNNFADAINPSFGYDAVSIHNAINVKVSGNTFINYGVGEVINVRNSEFSGVGSHDISITNNTIKNCPTTAIQISLAVGGETVFGCTDILIRGNTIEGATTGIFVTPGSGEAGTPLSSMMISENMIRNCTVRGIAVLANLGLIAEDISIINNKIVSSKMAAGVGIQTSAISMSKISGNTIHGLSNTTFTGLSMLDVLYTDILDNKVWLSDTSQTAFTLNGLTEGVLRGNDIRGTWLVENFTNSRATDNYFRNALGSVNGKGIVGAWWEFERSRIKYYAVSPPTTEAWLIGDKVLNSNPTAGSFEGWVCTASGTPGTWKGYGAIQA